MHYADSSRGRPFSKDPAVISWQDHYLMYYSLPPYQDGRANDGWAIGIAASQDLTTWRPVGEIMPQHDYEQRGLCAPGVLVRDGTVHLFYQTYGNGRNDAICHASSRDGLHFQRNPTNPIFRPTGSWNCGRAIDADLIVFGEHVLLYYATRDPAMAVQMLGVAAAPVGCTFERGDWVEWSDQPILAPSLPWEQDCIEAPALCERQGALYMFYAGAYNNRPQQIGVARSQDGISWQRLLATPFLANGAPDSWNASESGHPFLFTDRDQRTYLFFQGNNDHGATWYLSKVEVYWDADGPLVGT